MSNKVKMKCAVCHKSFKSSKPTQILCEDCERKRRQEKGAAVPVQPAQTATVTPAGTKPVWLEKAIVRDEKPSTDALIAPVLPAPRERLAPRGERPQRTIVQAGLPAASAVSASPKPKKVTRPPNLEMTKTPKPPREPAKLFEPTPAQKTAIEQRYLELAHPEFDGIRTQIAHELQLPKSAVKRVIAALRAQAHLPSWWEVQNFVGSPADLERIQVAYTASLPSPTLGIHKQIAQELQLPPSQVYHAIRSIRLTMGLPVFNPPEVHPELQTATTPATVPVH